MKINFSKKFEEEVQQEELHTKLLAIFENQYVKGSFIKKNGDLRNFEGRIIENKRTHKSICFQDFDNNGVIRSFSITSPHIVIESDDYSFELDNREVAWHLNPSTKLMTF